MAAEVSRLLKEALSRIDRPGSFCAGGSVSPVMPGLEVEGLGPVGLPLTAGQAKELKKRCEQAPYGKGEQTLVDTEVRRVWRLTPDKFSLNNPEWQAFLKTIVAAVQEELGLEKQRLESHLYDLLLYERGSFFLPHRDGEKLDRMVATLTVMLPSSWEGGELVVRHEGQEQVIDFSQVENSRFLVHYAAFYADCEHEIRPLRSGYRLCLVYNLTLAKSKKRIAAPRTGEHIERVSAILRDWSRQDAPRKLVVTLDHQYTRDGLTWDTLKGTDRVKAKVLDEAARQAGCQTCLALLTYHESGSAEYAGDGYGYGYGRRGRYRYYEDEDYEAEESASDYVMGEVFESSLTAENLTDTEGQRLSTGEIDVEEEELLDREALTSITPEEDFEGYTGNAGMTLDLWYRHAAVLLWPESRHFDVLCDSGVAKVVPALKQMVDRWKKARRPEKAALEPQCREFASRIIARWPERKFATSYYSDKPATGGSDLLPVLSRFGDAELVRAYLANVMARDASADPGRSLVRACAKHGWRTFRPELTAVFTATNFETLPRTVRLLEHFCLEHSSDDPEWSELCGELAERAVAALETVDTRKAATDWRSRELDRSKILAGLARSLMATGQDDLLSRAVDHALGKPKLYPPEVHVKVLSGLKPWIKEHVRRPCPPLGQWIAACRDALETLTAQAPQKPTDFRRPASLSCKCEDCRELSRFLKDPQAEVHRFPVRQDRRDHLEATIRADKCDVTCRTERRGSPYSLVCTKTTASYEAALEEYLRDRDRLKAVLAMQEELAQPAGA